MDQLWSFILLVVCALALALLSVSVICVYDNHCCVRLSVQLCSPETIESTTKKFIDRLQTPSSS